MRGKRQVESGACVWHAIGNKIIATTTRILRGNITPNRRNIAPRRRYITLIQHNIAKKFSLHDYYTDSDAILPYS